MALGTLDETEAPDGCGAGSGHVLEQAGEPAGRRRGQRNAAGRGRGGDRGNAGLVTRRQLGAKPARDHGGAAAAAQTEDRDDRPQADPLGWRRRQKGGGRGHGMARLGSLLHRFEEKVLDLRRDRRQHALGRPRSHGAFTAASAVTSSSRESRRSSEGGWRWIWTRPWAKSTR